MKLDRLVARFYDSLLSMWLCLIFFSFLVAVFSVFCRIADFHISRTGVLGEVLVGRERPAALGRAAYIHTCINEYMLHTG